MTSPIPPIPLGDVVPSIGDTTLTADQIDQGVLTNISPKDPPAMKTLVYSPDVRILIARGNKQFDVSSDIVAWSIRRPENSVASAVFRLANKDLRYNQTFERMDRVVVYLKRVEWIQVFSGYLDQVPHVQLYPGTVNFRASCTLKRLMHTWWDPGLKASAGIFDQAGTNVFESANGEGQADAGLGSLLRRLLIEVGGWKSQDVHIQKFPPGYFTFMEQQIKKYDPGNEQATHEFKRMLLGDDTSAGVGAAAGRQLNVTRGNYSLTAPERMIEVIRAVDEMGMGPDNRDLAAAQGIGTAATGGQDYKDQEAWKAQQEVGKNWSDAAMKNDAAVHCFMTVAVESPGWVMYANNAVPESLNFPHDAVSNDHDSIGLFQQRNIGWGTVAQRMNPRESAGMFLQRLKTLDWRNMDRGAACQAVQGSAFPGRYAQQEATAIEMVRALRTGTGTAQGAGGQSGGIPGMNLGGSVIGSVPTPLTAGAPGATALPNIPTSNGTPSAAAVGSLIGKPQYDTAGALTFARTQIGKPYLWGGTGPASYDCIAEGTLITTARGDIPIEEVTIADRVLTRKGYRSVTGAVRVRQNAEVIGIVVNGRSLEGTPDHRVWTENRGWVPLAEVATYDTLVSCRSVTQKSVVRPSSSKASRTLDIPIRLAAPTGIIFRALASCSIGQSGNTITDDWSLRGMKSTTWITTPSTMIPPISHVNRCLTIDVKVRHTANSTITSALNAESSFRPTVYHSASRGSVLVSTSRSSTTTSVRPRKSVYDLSVDGEHEFFANGVLVHNCSGLMQAAYRSIGMEIGRDTYSQARSNTRIPATNLVPGDLIQPNEGHVVMYTGNGTIVEAAQAGVPIHEVPIYFDMSSAACYHVPGAEYGGTPVAPFDPARAQMGGGASPGTVATGLGGGTAQVGSNEPIARNLFTYQFQAGQFANAISDFYGSQAGSEEKAFINDEPLIQTVVSFAKAGLRNFQSAPDGSFVAYYPDYFGLDGKGAIINLEDIEMKNVQIELNDDALATHVYVAGAALPNGTGGGGVLGWLNSKGVATVENEWLFRRLSAVAPHVPGEPLLSGKEIMKRFGVRPLVQSMSSVQQGPMEFLLAVQIFMTKWAEQYSTQIETTFMPEVFPGMRLNLVNHNLQVYVSEVTHSGDFENGFVTQMTIMAPSNPAIRNMATQMQNATDQEKWDKLDIDGNSSVVFNS